jgi:hypothetical protein
MSSDGSMLKDWFKQISESWTEKWMDMGSYSVKKTPSIFEGLGVNLTDDALAEADPPKTRFYGELQAALREHPDTFVKVVQIYNDHQPRSKHVRDRMDTIRSKSAFCID